MTTDKTPSLFEELYHLDISNIISTLEIRGGVDYIEWAEAWKMIKEFDPEATFEVIENKDGLPFFDSQYGVFVKVRVQVRGHSVTEIYAVDESTVSAQDINNACQRALVKALGRLGFGLQLWISEERTKLKKVREAKLRSAYGPKTHQRAVQAPVESEPEIITADVPAGDRIIEFGKKYIGKKFKDCPVDQIEVYMKWLEEDSALKGKPLSGPAQKFVNDAKDYIKSQEIPF